MKNSAPLRTTCPYCGVGCGIIATGEPDGRVNIAGDPNHPANFGRLCSKGHALGETLGMEGRLLHPEITGVRCDWDTALDAVANGFKEIIEQHGPESVAIYLSGQLLTEDYYVANKLMKGFIGSANVDTNSRLCMSSAVSAYKRAFGADVVPCSYEDIERTKLAVLAGSNAAWTHPVIYQRLARAKRDNPDLFIVVIDPRRTATCDLADLHLPLAPDSDAILFNGLLTWLADSGECNELFLSHHTEGADEALATARMAAPDVDSVAGQCGLPAEDVTAFFRLFARTERVLTLFSQGINQSAGGTDQANAIINCHLFTGRIGRPGTGPFSLTGQPNAMGGREVGGLANQLAAHMELDDPAARQRVQAFWNAPAMPEREGLRAVSMFDAIATGSIKAVWILGTNPAVSLPEADRVREALRRCERVVVSDCVSRSDTVDLADIRLPALTWGEKEGTVTNSERRISRQRAFLPPPGTARPDWWALAQVARRLGFGAAFDYNSPAAIFREHAALSGLDNGGQRAFDIGALAGLDDAGYQHLAPIQWPLPAGKRQDKTRLFSDGRFHTPSGRARLIPVRPAIPHPGALSTDMLVLNTGRIRDQWHTMTRTGRSPRLAGHTPEPYVEVSEEDALRLGLTEGGLAELSSAFGTMLARTRISTGQKTGSVFVPMHWSRPFASRGRVGALIAALVDPVSGQPALKQGRVRVSPWRPSWHGFVLSRRELKLDLPYWVLHQGHEFRSYEVAGDRAPEAWPAAARQILCSPAQDVGWAEYLAVSTYRAARLISGRLESCLFIEPASHPLPDRAWLESLFAADELNHEQRHRLLSGQSPKDAPSSGRTVCACHGVGENSILTAIREQGVNSVEKIGECLKAGTGCGACIPELKALLRLA
ncbi:nitrate reductase [Thiohalomonas denitrificans]|uniref:nitrate reductase n=1 Tax=Thiohalomonas denitrificans TaxID=415747 RepID=UPI0026F0EE8C|nr:nitrate reductase [Thiohalomonas denitrificans]